MNSHIVSNGWNWIDTLKCEVVQSDERFGSKWICLPPDHLCNDLKRSLKWEYDMYFSFEDCLLTTGFVSWKHQTKLESDVDDFVLLQLIYTHPDERGRGVAGRFLEHVKELAHKTDCPVGAVCRPFVHHSEITDEETPDLRQIGRDFVKKQNGLIYEDTSKEPGRNHQKQMVSLFKSYGWQDFDMDACMGDPKTFGKWAVVYDPVGK